VNSSEQKGGIFLVRKIPMLSINGGGWIMKTMKKVLAILLVCTLGLSLMACGKKTKDTSKDNAKSTADNKSGTAKEKDLIVVGYAQVGAESDWRTANTVSFQKTFTEANGYKLIFDDAQQKPENQIKAIRNFIQQDVDYIVLAPIIET
jgi:simple sugar transport system substrate-binding protein